MTSEEISHRVISEEIRQPATSSLEPENNSKDTNSSKSSNPQSRQNNLQKIQERKQQMYNWPQIKKLFKLASYSACQIEECKCCGWKSIRSFIKSETNETQHFVINLSDICKICAHTIEDHIRHLSIQSDEEINKLLGMALDTDNILMSIHREKDPDTKKVYFYLYKLLRRCIVSMMRAVIEGPLGQPPFERPNIAKVLMNFVFYKFSHLSPKEWQVMCDMAKMLLHCLNHWNFEAPNARRATISTNEAATYKINYSRWLVFCHVPVFCDSLTRYDTSSIFGKNLLQVVFKPLCRQLTDQCHNEKDRLTPEKRVLILMHFPRYSLNLFFFNNIVYNILQRYEI